MTPTTMQRDDAPIRVVAVPDHDGDLPVGTTVEVRRRFDRQWARGFAVAAVGTDSYQVRRLSDGAILPAWFPSDEVRPTP